MQKLKYYSSDNDLGSADVTFVWLGGIFIIEPLKEESIRCPIPSLSENADFWKVSGVVLGQLPFAT